MKSIEKEFKEEYVFQLYVSGMSERSMLAIENIKRFGRTYLNDHYKLEIIDIYKNPEVAEKMQIVFSPSLVKVFPLPQKILIGTFSNTEKVISALHLNLPDKK